MKKLQNNFTTPEQSKRLLELGVPANSADLYCVVKNNYTALLNEYVVYSSQEQEMIQVSKTAYRKELKKGEDILPCWSVGRLIELLCINDIFFDYGGCSYRRGYNIINYIISQLEAEDDLDFSELED